MLIDVLDWVMKFSKILRYQTKRIVNEIFSRSYTSRLLNTKLNLIIYTYGYQRTVKHPTQHANC